MQPALRQAALGIALVAGMALAPLPASGEEGAAEQSLTLDEARDVAQGAVLAGQPALARAIAMRLVEVDPNDARAWLILSASATAMGDTAEGRRAGSRAWIAAGRKPEGLPPALRYDIARHTAHAAWQDGRLLAAQMWLRRATDEAPDEVEYERTVADFREIRRQNPTRLAFSLSISPSNNLNGGSSSAWLTIDDWFYVGPQSGASLALSGVRTVMQARLDHALPADANGQTVLGLRAFGAYHDLSSEAQALAPGLSGKFLNVTLVEGTVMRQTRWPGSDWPVSVTLGLGHVWEAGESAGPSVRLEAETPLRIRENSWVKTSALSEWNRRPDGNLTSLGLALEGQWTLPQGTLSWVAAYRNGDAPDVNRQYSALSGEISYEPPRPIGDVRLRGSLIAGIKDYPAYMLGPFGVTDGREDETLGIALDIMPVKFGMMGYVPRLTLNAQATDSNISRFETRQIGVSLGIESQF